MTEPTNRTISRFSALMWRWGELEPERKMVDGPFVKVFDWDTEMRLVDEFGDDTPAGKYDDLLIEVAVRNAIAARGWSFALTSPIEPYPQWYANISTTGTTKGEDGGYRYEKAGESAVHALLEAYIAAMEAEKL